MMRRFLLIVLVSTCAVRMAFSQTRTASLRVEIKNLNRKLNNAKCANTALPSSSLNKYSAREIVSSLEGEVGSWPKEREDYTMLRIGKLMKCVLMSNRDLRWQIAMEVSERGSRLLAAGLLLSSEAYDADEQDMLSQMFALKHQDLLKMLRLNGV